MKESFWGYWIIVLGIFVVIIMMLISNVTTTNTQDYYLIKDVTEAAMVDAVDYAYYRQYQELKINREKFVENFLRRFAENVSLSTYTIDFYDIYEAPPKVSVKVTTESGTFSVMGDSTSFDIVNKVDAILELSGTSALTEGANSSNIKTDESVKIGNSSSSSGNKGESSTSAPSENTGSSTLPQKKKVSEVKVAITLYRNSFYYCNGFTEEIPCTKYSYDFALKEFLRLSTFKYTFNDKERAIDEFTKEYNSWAQNTTVGALDDLRFNSEYGHFNNYDWIPNIWEYETYKY